jgi:phenylpropionate dioxygenase-like ring-hydroxylating dioxygenase large terminal subunit
MEGETMDNPFSVFSAAENEILTRTGPGTPMGDLMRRYWLPAVRSEEMAEPDSDPIRIRILGEDLIVFRDTDGRPGILDQFCPHRRSSLFFARNEECGLRCAYHGWKFDVDGNVVDIPSEPDFASWRVKPTIKAYPAIERGGIVWTYMGAPGEQPSPPEYEYCLAGEAHRYVTRRWEECNWLQGLEGGIDPVHVPFLHKYEIHTDPLHKGNSGADFTSVTDMAFDSIDQPYGVNVIARRNATEGNYYWRITQFMFPCFTIAAPYGDFAMGSNAWVPRDDESFWRWIISCHPTRPLTNSERGAMDKGKGTHVQLDPTTLKGLANRDNDYLIDRAGQRNHKTYNGVYTVGLQDKAMQESQGLVHRRQDENLVSSDKSIIMVRKRLLEAVEINQRGQEPPGLVPEHQRIRSASLVSPTDVPFEELSRDILHTREGVPVTSI